MAKRWHRGDFTDDDIEAEEARMRGREIEACDRLLALLVEHHPEALGGFGRPRRRELERVAGSRREDVADLHMA